MIGVLKLTLLALGVSQIAGAVLLFIDTPKALDLVGVTNGKLSPLGTHLLHEIAGAFLAFGFLNISSYIMGSAARVKVPMLIESMLHSDASLVWNIWCYAIN
jgi:hypothetical protein